MTVFIALLRGVNVGGANRLKMADLKALVESAGFTRVRTLLQSGNVVFDGEGDDTAAAGARLEGLLETRMGKPIPVLVLTRAEFERALAANPHPVDGPGAGSRVVVAFLSRTPSRAEAARFLAGVSGPERCAVKGRAVYVDYVDGIADSKLKIDSRLGGVATARNWNTVTKLAALAADA